MQNVSQGARLPMKHERSCNDHRPLPTDSLGTGPRLPGDTSEPGWHETILDSIADGVFTVDSSFRITSFNRAAEEITGYSHEQALNRPCHEVFQANICNTACALRRTLETGEPVINLPVQVVNKRGAHVPISISTAILRSSDGRRVGGVETFRDLSALEELRKQVGAQFHAPEIVGKHPSLQRILELLPDVAQSDATVLIQGPSGSGKGLLASTIHHLSNRRSGPFIKMSCAALPEQLLESELFGYIRGAFTDAKRDKLGRLALAEGGTLFLDEICDVAPSVQVKLLHVLQDREYVPLGGTRTVKADIRVLAASNRDAKALVREGKFREDLYYRLNIVELHTPSLVERREDIPRLIERFFARENARTGKCLRGWSDDAMALLMGYSYPGNVRELENAIEHAFVLCRSGLIAPAHLPRSITEVTPRTNACEAPFAASPWEQAEARLLREYMGRLDGNRLAVARELNMHRTTLWRKLRRYGIA